MKKYTIALFVLLLLILAGCVLESSRLDYQENLNDYEIKKIVKEVLLSQNSINRAGLITSDGLQNIHFTRNRTLFEERYPCVASGYLTLYFQDNDFSLTLSSNDIFTLAYHNCILPSTNNYTQDRIDGSIKIEMHQKIEDRDSRLLDFSVHYLGTYLSTSTGDIFLKGKVGVHYDQNRADNSLHLSFNTNEFTIKNPTSYEKDTFYNLILDFHFNLSTLYYHYTYNGTIYNPYLGKLSFTTLESMQGYKDRNPFAGRLKITNKHLTLVVIPQDDYYVDIVVQNHYYSIYNRTIHTTWLNIGL